MEKQLREPAYLGLARALVPSAPTGSSKAADCTRQRSWAPTRGLGVPLWGSRARQWGWGRGTRRAGPCPQQLSSIQVIGSLHPMAVSRTWLGSAD